MRHSTLFVLGIATLPLLAQKPVINPGGVVNAASFAAVDGPSHALVPGAIASIFGRNLAASTAKADSYPLPRTLGGASVTVNGVAAPLFYVSPSQINLQVPSSTDKGSYIAYGRALVVVTTSAGASDPETADVWMATPGIFTQDGRGCGPGAILNVKPDGSRSLNSPTNSVSPGEYIEVYGTGLGETRNVPPDGMPAPANPPFETPDFAGGGYFGLTQPVSVFASFAGGAPGLAGVDQVNMILPTDIRQGCAVPLQIPAQFLPSQPVTLSIHSGGGQCVDPPDGSGGVLILKKSVVLNDRTVPESDTLTSAFTSSPGQTAIVPPFSETINAVGNISDYQGPACPVPGFRSFNPGKLTLIGPSGAQAEAKPVTAGSLGLSIGTPFYRAALPTDFVQPGVFRISSTGVPDVGPFQATLNVGSGIEISSQFPQGPTQGINPFVIRWTGGQPGMEVMFRVILHDFPYNRSFAVVAPATQGIARMPDGLIQGVLDKEIVILFGPDPLQPLPTVAVPGLTLGMQVMWLYEYRFIGLR
jgi:uncharacterized protein (TIGR03437 family)